VKPKLGKGLREFYTDAELKARFGTVNPTLEQRTNEFQLLWHLFGEHNEVDADNLDITRQQISLERKQLGAFNLITKGTRLRFRNKEDMVYFKLKYLK
jgi:hypothetical protein